jgi:hypothetical protein
MAIQSDYMKNRLLKNNQERVNNARRALYILGDMLLYRDYYYSLITACR